MHKKIIATAMVVALVLCSFVAADNYAQPANQDVKFSVEKSEQVWLMSGSSMYETVKAIVAISNVPEQDRALISFCIASRIQEQGSISMSYTCNHTGHTVNMNQTPEHASLYAKLLQESVKFCADSAVYVEARSESEAKPGLIVTLIHKGLLLQAWQAAQKQPVQVLDINGQIRHLSPIQLKKFAETTQAPVWSLSQVPNAQELAIKLRGKDKTEAYKLLSEMSFRFLQESSKTTISRDYRFYGTQENFRASVVALKNVSETINRGISLNSERTELGYANGVQVMEFAPENINFRSSVEKIRSALLK